MFANLAMAEDSINNSDRLRVGPHVGFSPYTGLIGAEFQKGHMGFTLGIPLSAGIRYYFDENGYRWFLGAHAMYYSIEDDETKDGVRYEEKDSTFAGLGFGYKWRWKNHWDLTLNLSVAYYRERLTNDSVERTDEYIAVLPGITIGYTF